MIGKLYFHDLKRNLLVTKFQDSKIIPIEIVNKSVYYKRAKNNLIFLLNNSTKKFKKVNKRNFFRFSRLNLVFFKFFSYNIEVFYSKYLQYRDRKIIMNLIERKYLYKIINRVLAITIRYGRYYTNSSI